MVHRIFKNVRAAPPEGDEDCKCQLIDKRGLSGKGAIKLIFREPPTETLTVQDRF